jgi:phosphoesterase RecJ-like protein
MPVNTKQKNKQGQWKGLVRLKKLLAQKYGKVTIITHINADGDAIGSSLGLLRILTHAGFECRVVVPNPYPGFLQWLPGNEMIYILTQDEPLIVDWIQKSRLVFFLDFNDPARIKSLFDQAAGSGAFITLVDHHPEPKIKAHCQVSDTRVSSTAELVYRWIHKTGLSKFIDCDVATCLYAGIMTDTGCFSYNSSTPETYHIVADLLLYGIDKDRIYYRIYDNFSCDRMRLLGLGLNERLEFFPEYRTAMIWLCHDDLKKYNFRTGDSEGFVNYPLSIKGIRFSAFFIEREDHIKVSFRSKGNFPVNKFSADYFNGGGHLNASGGESYDSLEATLQKFRLLLPRFKKTLNDYEE